MVIVEPLNVRKLTYLIDEEIAIITQFETAAKATGKGRKRERRKTLLQLTHISKIHVYIYIYEPPSKSIVDLW